MYEGYLPSAQVIPLIIASGVDMTANGISCLNPTLIKMDSNRFLYAISGSFQETRFGAGKSIRLPITASDGCRNVAPVSLLMTEDDVQAVMDLIGKLEHGVFS